MIKWLLFFHLTGVALWLGSVWASWILIRQALRLGADEALVLAGRTVRSITRGIANPSALVVLVSGVMMLAQLGLMGSGKPFWLSFMEQFGGLVILAAVAIFTWRLRNLAKAETPDQLRKALGRFGPAFGFVGTAVMVVILVVSLRLS